ARCDPNRSWLAHRSIYEFRGMLLHMRKHVPEMVRCDCDIEVPQQLVLSPLASAPRRIAVVPPPIAPVERLTLGGTHRRRAVQGDQTLHALDAHLLVRHEMPPSYDAADSREQRFVTRSRPQDIPAVAGSSLAHLL